MMPKKSESKKRRSSKLDKTDNKIEENISNLPIESTPNADLTIKDQKTITSVSFSQYSMWLKCPMHWKLAYIDKLAPYESSINTVFGDAIHEPLQKYLECLYTKGSVEADAIDVHAIFNSKFEEGIKELKIATDEQMLLTEEERDELGLITQEQIQSFKLDGKNILDHVMSPTIRRKHFPSKVYEFIGVELPLEIPIRKGKILYKGYLDIVLKDKMTNKILILDFKTSTYGWNKYQKMDRTKLDQLLLYKRFYHQLYKIPMDQIDVQFFVMKRKLYEDVKFPQDRIQRISPPDGKLSIRAVEQSFLEFINDCFTPEGTHNKDKNYIKNPEKGRKNCKYCIFKTLKNENGSLYCDGKEG
jgi:ATP-dependent exoDNAse (exonuclease V) beta subunit